MILADQLTREVSDSLAAAFLPFDELIQAVERAGIAPIAGRPGWAVSTPSIVLRRPLDPEFLEERRIEVVLVGADGSWRVHEVRGLPAP